MAKQLLQNRGFENQLEGYICQGSVSNYNDRAYSGLKSAKLIATPTSSPEICQVAFLIPPSSIKFSFYARGYKNEKVASVSNIRAEVNFINAQGTVIPPGIAITIRGRDISEQAWHYYEGYAEAPLFSTAAQVIIRLEPPESGSSGLLVDDLALVADSVPIVSPAAMVPPAISPYPGVPFAPPPAAASPVPPVAPTFPGWPFAPPPATTSQAMPAGWPNLLFPGFPFANFAPPVPGVPDNEEQADSPANEGETTDPGQKKK